MELAGQSLANTLVTQLKALHQTVPAIRAFVDWPVDLGCDRAPPSVAHPVAALFEQDLAMRQGPFQALTETLLAASPNAPWRRTYEGTPLFDQIMHRFGCYELIGYDGFVQSKSLRSFMVYMPPGFHYPWHEHPAEELYVVLAGAAEFHQKGQSPKYLSPGDTVFHRSGISHATTTYEQPVLCYVLWRNHFDTPPVWSEDAQAEALA